MQHRLTILRLLILLLSMIIGLCAVIGGLKVAGVVFGLTINGLRLLTG